MPGPGVTTGQLVVPFGSGVDESRRRMEGETVPVPTIHHGRPVLHSRARTESKAIEDATAVVGGPAEAAVVFQSGASEADDTAARLAGITDVEPLIGPVGPVTGTHPGPRGLVLADIGRADTTSP